MSPPVYKPVPRLSPPDHWSEHVQAQNFLTEFYGIFMKLGTLAQIMFMASDFLIFALGLVMVFQMG